MKKFVFLLMVLVFVLLCSTTIFAGVEPSPFYENPVTILNPVIQIPVRF